MNDPDKLSSPDPQLGTGRIYAKKAADPVHAQSPPGHELTDVSPASIGLFALGLVLMVALVLPLLNWTFWRFEAAARRADPIQSPLAGDQTPPKPRLQVRPTTDLQKFRQEEEQRLSSYGWIDQERNVVRIPIDRAMEILAERGLPEPDGPPEPSTPQERSP